MKSKFKPVGGNADCDLTIAAFTRSAGVHVETIRFYQRKGLLIAPGRPLGSIRRYGSLDVARVRFIKSAQQLGFSLDEVSDLLRLEDGSHCDQARLLAERKLSDIKQKIAHLRRMEKALTALIPQCSANHTLVNCPLIDALHA